MVENMTFYTGWVIWEILADQASFSGFESNTCIAVFQLKLHHETKNEGHTGEKMQQESINKGFPQ